MNKLLHAKLEIHPQEKILIIKFRKYLCIFFFIYTIKQEQLENYNIFLIGKFFFSSSRIKFKKITSRKNR